jgi:hypothetical protein
MTIRMAPFQLDAVLKSGARPTFSDEELGRLIRERIASEVAAHAAMTTSQADAGDLWVSEGIWPEDAPSAMVSTGRGKGRGLRLRSRWAIAALVFAVAVAAVAAAGIGFFLGRATGR